jgi:glycosyltransferase involved in cell wall biosynthesis
MKSVSISAVVPVHNGERYIVESLTAILSQTRPPDEIIVVDDGSTDRTDEELRHFGGHIRVVKQANRGVAGALNRCFEESRGAYIAKCDADDIWELDKLERQVETLLAHPEIDIAFSGARFFGLADGPRAPYAGDGLLDRRKFARRLYRGNFICSCTTVIKSGLYRRLGPFDEEIACEDYDFWLRALTAGAVFFHDPSILVRCRAHSRQVSNDLLRMHEAEYLTHIRHAGLVDSRLAHEVRARDLSNVARVLSDQDRPSDARKIFKYSLRHRPTLRVAAWVLVLSAPDRFRRRLADLLVSIKRTLHPRRSSMNTST